MKLISSRETINFLTQAAPRPWVQRMLRWMVSNEELNAYFIKGTVQPHSTVSSLTSELYLTAREFNGPKMDAAIRDHYSPELAAKLVGRGYHDRVDDEPITWDESEEPRQIDPGFFLYASEIDWDQGTLYAEWLPCSRELQEPFFPSEDIFYTEFDDAEFEASLSGMNFDLYKIEMLLPNLVLHPSTVVETDGSERRRSVGRPAKWDWEGAMAFVVSMAQLPDGLPTGPGAQARIEEIIAGWFVDETGDAPAASQVRQRAAKVVRMLERSKRPETK